jgi:hypothetical protein
MSSDVPVGLSRLVAERADYCCEYCLLPQAVTLHQHESVKSNEPVIDIYPGVNLGVSPFRLTPGSRCMAVVTGKIDEPWG